MGKITDSFKRQIGRDSGKVVTNLIFGDKHSSPYRRVASKAETKRMATENKVKMQEQQNLHAIDGAVIGAIDQVISLSIPDDLNSITKLMDELEIQLIANKWGEVGTNDDDDKERKVRNKYPDAVLQKYKQSLRKLKSSGADEEEIKYYSKKLRKFKIKKIWGKNKTLVVVFFGVIFLILVGVIGSAFE